MTFLQVVTRCYKRPNMLRKNIESLQLQDDQDFEQYFLVDTVGFGIGFANSILQDAPIEDDVEYVMILDDDDYLADSRAIAMMKEAAKNKPDLLIFKADHKQLGILPSPFVWKRRPLLGRIGSCDFITRSDVWKKHIHAFAKEEAGDYAFLRSVWDDKPQVVWLDALLASVQQISKGKTEC